MNKKIYITKSVEETNLLALNLAKSLKSGDMLIFFGDLGSGKTTFIQGLAKGLKIKQRISSPTFIIVRHYEFDIQNNKNSFYHIDLYRTSSKSDLIGVGLDQIIADKNNIAAIEWGEKLGDLLPEKRIEIRLKNLVDEKREITIERYE